MELMIRIYDPRLARCDHPGCTAELRVGPGSHVEAQAELVEHGWSLRRTERVYDPDVFCPAHWVIIGFDYLTGREAIVDETTR